MTVSDQDTKMDVDIVTPNDTPGSHTHLTDPPSTLKDASHAFQPTATTMSTDPTALPQPPNNPGAAAVEPMVQDQQPQQQPQTQPVEETTPSTTAVTAPEISATAGPEVDDDGDEDLYKSRHPSAVFRPQLDDIVMDQDLLDFYEQLKFLVSLSPLKTAQVLYAFSLATEHLSPELEVRRSVLDMSRRAFSFYQENTWFTVDLESNEDLSDDEAYESSDPKFRILPARHGLFPALQKQPFGYQSNPAYYNPYPPYPYPYYAEPGHYLPENAEPRPASPKRQDGEGEQEREHSESSVRPSGSVTKIRLRTSGYDDRSPKKSRRDPDSPSLSSMDGVRKHHRQSTETGDANMDLTQRKDSERHRDRERDADYERERMERRLARKLKKQARAGEHASGDRQKDGSSSQTKIRPLKITLVQSGKSGSNSAAQDSVADGTGHDASKASQSWNPNGDRADSSSNAHRSIQPQNNNAAASADDGASAGSGQKPASINTQAPQPIPRKPKHAHALQASPVQTTSTHGGQTAPGPFSNDKSDDKLKKGTWTAAEEEILLEAVRGLSSENWHAVAQMVPGRNAKQCMQKWQTDLDPQINRLPWTDAEDEKLVEAYHRYGNSWQQIAKMVETRTWYQCYNRVRAKSVKTKIQQTTGTHPASIANGGIPGGPRPEGSKPGSKRDGEKRKGHGSQGGMTSGLASGPSMDPQSQSGPSQPRPAPLNGESNSNNSNSGDYIRVKGQQMQGVLALGPSAQAQGSIAGHRDQPTSSPSQGPPSNTEGAAPSTSSSDYHRSSPMSARQQEVPQSQGVKPAPSTPSNATSQAQFQPPQHLHSPQQSHQQHHSQHQQSPQQRPPQHQPSQPLKSIKTEPTTPQPKSDAGYWPKQPTSSSSPRAGSPKGYRTPQHSQSQQQQQQPSPHRQHNHNISPAQSHSPSHQSQHHPQQGMQPPPPPSSHSTYPSQSPGPTAIHMTYESQSSNSSNGGSAPGKSSGAGLGIHQSYSSQQQAPSQQQSQPYQQHHRQQPSPHQQHQQQSPQQQQQSPHYRQKSSSNHLRPVPPLSATLSKGQSPSSAGSSSPSISMQPQHGNRPPLPMSQKSHSSSYSPSTLPPIQQHHAASQQPQRQQSPKPYSGSQRLPSFNGPPPSSTASSTTSSSASSPHPLLPPVQAHSQQPLPPFQGQRQQQAPPSSPPPPQALGSQSSSSYSPGPPPSIVTSAKMTPPGPGSGAHSTYSTPVLAPPLLSPTIANSPTGGFISTSALLMMARNAQQQQQQHRQSPGGGGSNSSTPSTSIPPP
ncbi:hypothetical protein BGZ88_010263 [Linnemannia elongata]|nr:hypothetical protein BGZ88_010263 [Linnemannia elongata]